MTSQNFETILVRHRTRDKFQNCELCGTPLYTVYPIGQIGIRIRHIQYQYKWDLMDGEREIWCDGPEFAMILVDSM